MVTSEITPIPQEQELIEALSDELRPLHRFDLHYHNFEHSHNDVLPEVLDLDTQCHPEGNPSERRLHIAASLGHEVLWHLKLDPQEGFSSKEERSAQIVGELLPAYDYNSGEIEDVRRLIGITKPGATCVTEADIKMRRGDIKNVASKIRAPFLATTVKLFYEALLINQEAGSRPPAWTTFVKTQEKVLSLLLKDDLSLPFEVKPGMFNRAAGINVGWLSQETVLNPSRFVRVYGHRLKPLVPMLHETDLTRSAAS